MSYKIIGDSSMDLCAQMVDDPTHFQTVPLTIQIGDRIIVDDESFDQPSFLELIAKSPECPRSACPSPDAFLKAYECDADDIYVLTITEKLSGTCNAARIAKQLYEEKYGEGHKNIAVISSDSASAGETLLGLMIHDLCRKGEPFAAVRDRILDYVKKMQTVFMIEDLSTLRKNGRLSGTAAFFATALNIKPILYAEQGEIQKLDQARGIAKALKKLCDYAVTRACAEGTLAKDAEAAPADRLSRAVITHCNCAERAEQIREELQKLAHFDEIVIAPTRGLSSVYANSGGVIVAV